MYSFIHTVYYVDVSYPTSICFYDHAQVVRGGVYSLLCFYCCDNLLNSLFANTTIVYVHILYYIIIIITGVDDQDSASAKVNMLCLPPYIS